MLVIVIEGLLGFRYYFKCFIYEINIIINCFSFMVGGIKVQKDQGGLLNSRVGRCYFNYYFVFYVLQYYFRYWVYKGIEVSKVFIFIYSLYFREGERMLDEVC